MQQKMRRKMHDLPPLIIALIIAVPRGRIMHDKSNLSYTLCEIVGSPTQWRFSHEIQAISRTLWNRHLRRSEEHTSELQSLMRISYAVFCLKKKIINHVTNNLTIN